MSERLENGINLRKAIGRESPNIVLYQKVIKRRKKRNLVGHAEIETLKVDLRVTAAICLGHTYENGLIRSTVMMIFLLQVGK